METSLLKTFADNYKVDGIAYRSLFRINDKVNGELYPNIMARYEDLPISLQKKHDQEVSDIIEGTKSFDPSILFHELQSPLMCEINDNLIEIMDNERKLQRYLDMLILPFGKVAGLFHPDDEIDSLNQTLDKSNIPPQQEYCQREIENLNYRAKRMTELIASQSPLENLEHCAMAWFIFLKKYAESLAALLLTYDIDLIAEQAKRGIVLIGSISENMLFMQYGSYKQAQERYTAWKERNGAVADDEPKSTTYIKNKDFKDCILYEDKERLMQVLHSMIDTASPSKRGMVLTAAYKLQLITKPTFKQFTNSFGEMTKSVFHKYFTPNAKLELCDPDVSTFKSHLNNVLGLPQ